MISGRESRNPADGRRALVFASEESERKMHFGRRADPAHLPLHHEFMMRARGGSSGFLYSRKIARNEVEK